MTGPVMLGRSMGRSGDRIGVARRAGAKAADAGMSKATAGGAVPVPERAVPNGSGNR